MRETDMDNIKLFVARNINVLTHMNLTLGRALKYI
jgi:hypothetical protein